MKKFLYILLLTSLFSCDYILKNPPKDKMEMDCIVKNQVNDDKNENGCDLKVPVFQFLKESLTRKYGEEWYHELTVAAEMWKEEKKNK